MINKNRNGIKKTISYKLQFINRARFMASSLLNLVYNLPELIYKIKWKCRHLVYNLPELIYKIKLKCRHDNEKCKTCETK